MILVLGNSLATSSARRFPGELEHAVDMCQSEDRGIVGKWDDKP